MLSYHGLIAIFNKSDTVIPLISSANTSIWFSFKNTFDYTPLSECFIFRIPAYSGTSRKQDFPFIFIKPTDGVFAFLEWDSTSIYYGFKELDKDIITVTEIHPVELNNLNIKKRTNETFNLNNFDWFDVKMFGKALNKYFP